MSAVIERSQTHSRGGRRSQELVSGRCLRTAIHKAKVQALQRGRAPLRRAGPSATPSLRKERSDPLPEGKGHSSLRSARKAKRGNARHEINPCVHKTTYMLVCLTRSPNWCSLVPHGHRKKNNLQCQSERNLCNARPSLFFRNEHRYFVADIEVDCATSRGILGTQHDRLFCILS